MGRLDDISMDELQTLREETVGEIPRERVLAAIARKQGDGIDRIAERHGVVEKTIRNWLERFADRPLERAPYDEQRSGRPAKLADGQREELFEELETSPRRYGYDQREWTATLVKSHVERTYGVEYSTRHARLLLREAVRERLGPRRGGHDGGRVPET